MKPILHVTLAALLAGLIVATPAWAKGQEDHSAHQFDAAAGCDRSAAAVALPATKVTRHDGTRVSFATDIATDRPVILNFIYTSCTAICPPMTQAFADVQRKLGADRGKVQMVSVSLDPDHDTPTRLRDYAARFGAGDQWRFYTGTQDESTSVQKAFNVYRTDKMGHTPVTFLHAPGSKEWIRLDGFISPGAVAKELRRMAAGG